MKNLVGVTGLMVAIISGVILFRNVTAKAEDKAPHANRDSEQIQALELRIAKTEKHIEELRKAPGPRPAAPVGPTREQQYEALSKDLTTDAKIIARMLLVNPKEGEQFLAMMQKRKVHNAVLGLPKQLGLSEADGKEFISMVENESARIAGMDVGRMSPEKVRDLGEGTTEALFPQFRAASLLETAAASEAMYLSIAGRFGPEARQRVEEALIKTFDAVGNNLSGPDESPEWKTAVSALPKNRHPFGIISQTKTAQEISSLETQLQSMTVLLPEDRRPRFTEQVASILRMERQMSEMFLATFDIARKLK